MSYVGWKDMKSAMRYIEASPFPRMKRTHGKACVTLDTVSFY